MTDGELIRFPRAPDDAVRGPLEVDRPAWDDCKHPRPFVLDVEAHELRCAKCGQVLDVFDFLLRLTNDWERFNTGYRDARRQERAALGRVEHLKKVEKNAKARIRKHGVVLTSAQARVVLEQLRALQHVAINLAGGREEAERLARLNGVDSGRLREAVEVLREQVHIDERRAV